MMRIKVAVYISDQAILDRFVMSLENMVGNKLELSAFSALDKAKQFLQKNKGCIFLREYTKKAAAKDYADCITIYLVDSDAIREVNGHPAICMYLRADMLYRQMVGIYSEHMDGVLGERADAVCSVIAFLSPAGGVGSSTAAAGFAANAAQHGKKTLYINLENNGDTSAFFGGAGQTTLSDVLYDVKSKKSNFAMRLESKVLHDDRGVDFLASSPSALDTVEIGGEDVDRLLQSIRRTGLYEIVVLDSDCGMDERMMAVLRCASSVVIVCDGRETGSRKLARFRAAMQDVAEESGQDYTAKFRCLYNRADRSHPDRSDACAWELLGEIDDYAGEPNASVIDRIARSNLFDSFLGV